MSGLSSAERVVTMADWITVDELAARLKDETAPRPFKLVDVRYTQIGEISGAVHIPVLDLEEKLPDWPKDTEIVVFCQFGKGASDYAAEVFEQEGYCRVRKLQGGMDAWLKATERSPSGDTSR